MGAHCFVGDRASDAVVRRDRAERRPLAAALDATWRPDCWGGFAMSLYDMCTDVPHGIPDSVVPMLRKLQWLDATTTPHDAFKLLSEFSERDVEYLASPLLDALRCSYRCGIWVFAADTAGAFWNARGAHVRCGNDALQRAAKHGDVCRLKALIACGVDPLGARDVALWWSIRDGNHQVAECLLRAGGRMMHRLMYLHHMAMIGHTPIAWPVEAIIGWRRTGAILQFAVDIRGRVADVDCALHVAIVRDHRAAIGFFTDRGAVPDESHRCARWHQRRVGVDQLYERNFEE
jgi:hypothetical protein